MMKPITDTARFRMLCIMSVALTFSLCKLAFAEEPSENPAFWDGLRFGGYSSAGITLHPNREIEAELNQISLITSWSGDSRFRFFSELELERPLTWNEDSHFSHDDAYIDLERLYVDYNLSVQANLRAGRFLTPAGIWNELHAAPLVWTTTRPLATSRLFPQGVNGAMLYGAIPLENHGLEYNVYAEALRDQHRDGDETLFKDVSGARVTWTGTTNFGLSVMRFKERISHSPEFRLIGLDFLTRYHDWEFSGEAFQRNYSDGANGGSGAYVQAVAPLRNRWFAVGRVETFQRPQEGSSERWLLGTAWRIDSSRVLKIEIIGGDEERSESPKGLLTSFAILF